MTNRKYYYSTISYKAPAVVSAILSFALLLGFLILYFHTFSIIQMIILAIAINKSCDLLEEGSIKSISSLKNKRIAMDHLEYIAFIILIGMIITIPVKYTEGFFVLLTHIIVMIVTNFMRADRKREYYDILFATKVDDGFIRKFVPEYIGHKYGVDIEAERQIYIQANNLQRVEEPIEEPIFLKTNSNENSTPQQSDSYPIKKMPHQNKPNQPVEKSFTGLDELNSLIGMNNVKNEINTFIQDMIMSKKKEKVGIKNEKSSMHMVFSGSAGTGKTTVARIISQILYELGYLSKGHIVETDREGLIGQHVGQTAAKTKEMVQEALGGVLFIDEAYSLTPRYKEGFEPEAIDTLVKLMEDNRKDLVVIFAGYTNEMKEFIKINTGLASRVPYWFNFEPYNNEEMALITQGIISKGGYELDTEATTELNEIIEILMPYSSNQNGRMARTLVEKAIKQQNSRLYKESPDDINQYKTITHADMGIAANQIREQSRRMM